MKVNEEKLLARIGFKPHEGQREVLRCKSRDIVLECGRRWGKSLLAAYIVLKTLLADDKKVWIVAPTYDLAGKVFEYLVKWIAKAFPSASSGISYRPTPSLTLPWGSILECKSAENPTSLLGEELDLVVVDEAARVSKGVYESYLYPTTASRKGRTIFISTPFGKGWFFNKGLEVKETGGYFHFRSVDNPYFPKEEYERAKKSLPSRVVKQEYDAIALDNAASIFRDPRDCINGEFEDYNKDHLYVVGVDIGRFNDFTVIVVIDRMTNRVVYFDRFNDIAWSLQKSRIKQAADKYGNPLIYMDATSITAGDVYVDELANEGYNIIGYKIGSNLSKRQLVEKLSAFIDQKLISYPDIEVLIDELEAFTYTLSPSGNIKYSAPEGLHDDCVIALALAVWDLDENPLEEIKGGKTKILSFPAEEFE